MLDLQTSEAARLAQRKQELERDMAALRAQHVALGVENQDLKAKVFYF